MHSETEWSKEEFPMSIAIIGRITRAIKNRGMSDKIERSYHFTGQGGDFYNILDKIKNFGE